MHRFRLVTALLVAMFLVAAGGLRRMPRTIRLGLCGLSCRARPAAASDIIARHIAQRLTARLPHPVFVENRTGAGSLVGTDFVAKAPADGHTLLMGGLFNIVMNSALIKNCLTTAARLRGGRLHIGLSVRPARAEGLAGFDACGFAAYAKARPGQLNYASAGLCTLQHVWGTSTP